MAFERINENVLARNITKREGGALSLSIGQVKEVLRLTLEELATYPASSVMELVERHLDDAPACPQDGAAVVPPPDVPA